MHLSRKSFSEAEHTSQLSHPSELPRGSGSRPQASTRSHNHSTRSRRRLSIVLFLTLLFMVAEALGGWWTGSLALLADAGHALTDVAALALALLAVWFAGRPATPSKTFGYYRLEILAALINGVALVLISFFIFYEAYRRWASPPEVKSGAMMLVAFGGLLINLSCAWILHAGHEDDLNIHGAWLHVMGDALGSVGALAAGALMSLYGWYTADPLFGIMIGLLIVWSSWNLISESTNVLLEGTPAHISLAAIEAAVLETPGVADVHDLHVWTITSGREALSAHIIHEERVSQPALLKELRNKLHDRFGLDHLTIQMESTEFEAESFYICDPGSPCFRSGQKPQVGADIKL